MDALTPIVVSVGGWDPSGGAGLAADIKSFEMHRVRGMGVCSAVTSQSHNRFDDIQWVETEVIVSQLSSLIKSYRINGIKFGIIQSPKIVELCVKRVRESNPDAAVVWDPVIKASAGFDFHKNNTRDFLEVLKLVDLVTPNLPEAEWLLGTSDTDCIREKLKVLGAKAVLLKGGHAGSHADDLLIQPKGIEVFKGERFESNPQKHGSGCVFSAALCALLSKGNSLTDACRNAKKYTERFILSSSDMLGWHFYS